MNEQQQYLLQVYFQEYEKLKDEQAQRIGFRDNIIFVTIGAFGGILSFALSNKISYYALLVIPWVCLILGWIYLVNDEKISAIGRYIRITLAKKITDLIGNEGNESILGWEVAHRNDKLRKSRKIEQLIIDEITFVFSGFIALLAFLFSISKPTLAIQVLVAIEFMLLLFLAIKIFIYTDIAEGK
ncbi:hypothetical protein [Gloeothece verrucosa]|uniref:Integral membrane protein n=1 Tax=Gloeothece verrucosa (strain PCC 7822) TaxID=497965 RepID=E0U8A6_GLOV7|nr:hypothetical protein [Gloeothece verrucosa]ADN12542.1 integral membrane protein [Gloeothece verrucosa PCC 7822]